jgi:hypothetical protein
LKITGRAAQKYFSVAQKQRTKDEKKICNLNSNVAVAVKVFGENTTRSEATGGDFFKPLVLPLQVCFFLPK